MLFGTGSLSLFVSAYSDLFGEIPIFWHDATSKWVAGGSAAVGSSFCQTGWCAILFFFISGPRREFERRSAPRAAIDISRAIESHRTVEISKFEKLRRASAADATSRKQRAASAS